MALTNTIGIKSGLLTGGCAEAIWWETGRLELARRMAEEALDLVERIGLGALREDVEGLLRELQ